MLLRSLILCVLVALSVAPVSLGLGLCTDQCSGAVYGDARVPGAAPVFADLVGVVCKGACYIEASRWSTVAIQHGDTAVQDANECRRICAITPGCEVWTLIDTQCQLKRALDAHGFKPLVNTSSDRVASAGASVFSGTATCTGQEMAQLLLPFPSGLDEIEVLQEPSVAGCVHAGKVYGSFAMGSCDDAPLLAVHARSTTLSLARQYSWFEGLEDALVATGSDSCDPSKCRTPDGRGGYDCWGDGITESYTCADGFEARMTGQSFQQWFEFECCKPSAKRCALLCHQEKKCGGWSLDHGSCLLWGNTAHDCEPKISTESRAGIVSGLASCQLKEDVPAGIDDGGISSLGSDSWYDECGQPRCNLPVTLGSFFADGNFKPQGCFYEVFGISQAREHMRSKWMVISGGSNAILTAIAVGNVMEPEGAHATRKERQGGGCGRCGLMMPMNDVDVYEDKDRQTETETETETGRDRELRDRQTDRQTKVGVGRGGLAVAR